MTASPYLPLYAIALDLRTTLSSSPLHRFSMPFYGRETTQSLVLLPLDSSSQTSRPHRSKVTGISFQPFSPWRQLLIYMEICHYPSWLQTLQVSIRNTTLRPIFLLCPDVRVLEWPMLPILNSFLSVDDTHHGFRPLRFITPATFSLGPLIIPGINQLKSPFRTVAFAVNVYVAFDIALHHGLMEMIRRRDLPNNLIRWLAGFLPSRQTSRLSL